MNNKITQTQKIENDLCDKFGVEKAEKLVKYAREILRVNKDINLTSIREYDEFLRKHIIDSLCCCDFLEYKEAQTVVDIGTGGGFPGVPLAIISPSKEFLLIDSSNKKLMIVKDLCDELNVQNVKVVHGRAEDLGRDKIYRESFDLAVSRAVASMSVICEWALPFVKKGGFFIAYKGRKAEEEVAEAQTIICELGGVLAEIKKCESEFEDMSDHKLVVIKKTGVTSEKYPKKVRKSKKISKR